MKHTYYSHSPDKLTHVRKARVVAEDLTDDRRSPFLRRMNITGFFLLS